MEMLELVGLEKRWASKVKTYSHGMKQRLGLAQALLHDPDLIILDEPTTGLDPQGMKEIRDLIIYLSKEKEKTIFLSSHILREVEIIADRMIIINEGTTQIEGSVSELLNRDKLQVRFEVDQIQNSIDIINSSRWSQFLKRRGKNELLFEIGYGEISELNKYLVENGIGISAVVPTRSLEEFFLKITNTGRI